MKLTEQQNFTHVTDCKGEVILYQPNDNVALEVMLDKETVWLTQHQMSILFAVKENNITYHIKSIFKTHELDSSATTQKIRVVRKEGLRQVNRNLDYYNLDMIISVGYRVNSANATRFRRWATSVLKEYLLRCYVINQRLVAMEERINRHLAKHENILQDHQKKIDFFIRTNLSPIEQVFFESEFFEARMLLEKIIKTAKIRVIIIDAYIDATIFEMLDVRNKGVSATIYSGRDLTALRNMHNTSANVEFIETRIWSQPAHDRWLIIDDLLFHCGHSLKDMGRKLSAIMLMGTSPEIILEKVR